jgi:hypothetical protein
MYNDNKSLQGYNTYFEVQSKIGILISTTKNYWDIITHIKHPAIKGREKEVKEAIYDPDEIRVSKRDKSVLLLYKGIEKKYLCVVIRYFNNKGFIITAYWTKKIKEGELKWKR